MSDSPTIEGLVFERAECYLIKAAGGNDIVGLLIVESPDYTYVYKRVPGGYNWIIEEPDMTEAVRDLRDVQAEGGI
jgi:hypothetical protein